MAVEASVNDEAASIAKRIADDYEKSAFATQETLEGWIATALRDTATRARFAEHDRIENILGTAKFQQVRKIVQVAQLKWKHLGNVPRGTNQAGKP